MMTGLTGKRVILTGAAGGIGSALALLLGRQGARLGLVGRNDTTLLGLANSINAAGGNATVITADVTVPTQRQAIVDTMIDSYAGIDILVNNAGTMQFTEFSSQSEQAIENTINTNLLAPMLLARAVLPTMHAQGRGQIVNVGSIFGSIGFAWFGSYSASKFGLRGFSESLRRELAGSGIQVTYIAPRSVKTSLNSSAVYKMAERVKMNLDDPAVIAGKILEAISRGRKDVYLGFPESFFVRLNALLPRRVDAALKKQNAVMREFLDV